MRAIVVAICLLVAAQAAADDWGVRRDPFDLAVVRRYKALLARDPHDARALRELVALYQRHRSRSRLESEYRAQLGTSDDWATLVILARLTPASNAESRALWRRALAAKPDDARGWLAVGDATANPAEARDAYRRAATHATSPRDKRRALIKLVGAARRANDHAAVDGAYRELIALAGKRSGALWLERGEAQLAAGRAADARESFATAATLLRRDPERRFAAMMNQGIALERMGRTDDAIAQYLHTLDRLPRGYHLASELVSRVIDAERKRHRLSAAIALLEARWPERRRGHFEWSTLGSLFRESGDDARALAAYKRAVAKAPTEVATQRTLIALLDKLAPADALAQHEAAARVAPGDADLQIALAKRYYRSAPDKAFATLARLARRMRRNVNVRQTIAQLYVEWEQPTRAIREYEAIVALEPNEPDHAIVLGNTYWRDGQHAKALAAWHRLQRIGTTQALLRHGEVLAIHEEWLAAADAYTKALARDPTNVAAWHGRAHANDAVGRFPEALADAKRAVALIGHASSDDGFRERHLLVRVLGHWHAADGAAAVAKTLARWRFAFDRGDVAAGYLLAAHHGRIGSKQHHDLLVQLYRRVPTDDSLGIEVARSYKKRQDFSRAREELQRIARRSPARREEIAELLVDLEADRVRAEQEARWDAEGLSERERAARRTSGIDPGVIGRHRRFGVRLGVGGDVRHTSSALLGLGVYRSHGIAPGTAIVARAEWTQRDDEMEEVNAFAASVGITRRVVDARTFELAVGAAPRVEVRYGSDAPMSSWKGAALAGDLMLELVPRSLPATLGLRFHQTLTDTPRNAALLLELGFEVR